MGDGNSGNSINICGMNLQTVLVIISLIFCAATFGVKTAMLADDVVEQKQQIVMMKDQIADLKSRVNVSENNAKELKEITGTLTVAVNKLSEVTARMDGKLSR